MCKNDFLPDHNLDEPDYNRFEEEPNRDAPTNASDDLIDELWLIGTGKTRKEWGND